MGEIIHYKAKDFFWVRIPIFSRENYKELTNVCNDMEEQIELFINDSVLMEGIAVASPDLYKKIEQSKEDGTIRSNKKIYMSLLKYAIRACTRTTPFGLFCGITMGEFLEKTEIIVDSNEKYCKRARADMEWISQLFFMLEEDSDFMQNVTIYVNDLLYKKGDRVINPCVFDRNSNKKYPKYIVSSVRYTGVLHEVLEMCKKGVLFREVVDEIINRYNGKISKEKAVTYVQTLLLNGYLISEFRIAKSNFNPLKYLRKCLEKNPCDVEWYKELCDIDKQISTYNPAKLGEGLKILEKIEEKMSKITRVKNYVQIDYKVNTLNCSVNHRVKEKCELIVEKLVKLGTGLSESDYFQRYKQCFKEKYGFYREVPLMKLLDEEEGLGAPESYSMPKRQSAIINPWNLQEDEYKKKLKRWIKKKILLAYKNDCKEIIITEEDIEELEVNLPSVSMENTPASMDMFFFIHAKDEKSIDKGEYELGIAPVYGIDKAGRAIGRFSDMLDNQESENYSRLFLETQELIKEKYILAELIEEPLSGKMGNVIMNQNIAEYQTVVGGISGQGVKQINIRDILVGLDRKTDKFYLKSKSFNKRILYTSFNMGNPVLGSNIQRFLREVSSAGELNFLRVINELLIDDFTYIPSIKYLNCVLIPSTWRLSWKELNEPKDFNDFQEKFNLWKKNWAISNHIYYKKGDDLFQFNLENRFMLEEFYRTLKKAEKMELVDYNDDIFWVKDKNNKKYAAEFVFMFFREKTERKLVEQEAFETKSCISKNQVYSPKVEKERISMPGEDGWWYFKLYGTELETIICEKILPFCDKGLREKLIDGFYFIRYTDPALHIRLRIKMSDEANGKNEEVINWLNSLKENQIIREYTINFYERELERYGGTIPFRYAEKFFFYDSMYVSELLRVKRTNTINEKLAVLSNLLILNIFTSDLNQLLRLFEVNFGDLKMYKKEFKRELKDYISIYRHLKEMLPINRLQIESERQRNNIVNLMNLRNVQFEKYVLLLKEQDKKEMLSNSFDNIILSVMHMHCNRFNGNKLFEYKVLEYTYRTIFAFKNYKKYVLDSNSEEK